MAFPRLAVAVAVVATAAGVLASTAIASASAYATTTFQATAGHSAGRSADSAPSADSTPTRSTAAPRTPDAAPPARSGRVVAAGPVAAGRPMTGVSYSYWGFYQWSTSKHAWQFSTVGANDKQTAESTTGSVYGFRWALVVKAPRPPRAPGDFAAICGKAKAPAHKKRIAFVIDFGTPADSPSSQRPPKPRGLCAVVPTSATAQQALDSVTSVRTGSSALICGIDGYPSAGCGQKVTDATPPPPDGTVQLQLPSDKSTAAGDSGGSSLPWVIVAVVVIAALGLGAWVLRARRG